MLSLFSQFFLLGVFLFFAIGLNSTVAYAFQRIHRSDSNELGVFHQPAWEGLRLLLGIVSYSMICNALLLIPSVLQFAGLPNDWILGLHRLSLAGCVAISLALALIGCLVVVRRPLKEARNSWLCQHIPSPEPRVLQTLAISGGAYLILAQLNVNSYDLGLYHYPYVSHLVHFGPETGLANLHVRFGFYNVQSFGQAPWQALCGTPGLLSPSLNIIFFSAFLLHFLEAILPKDVNSSTDRIAPLILMTLGLGTGIYNFGSLAGFDADLSLSISSLMLIDAFYRWAGTVQRIALILMSTMAPLIKLSGVLTLAVIIIYLSMEAAIRHFVVFKRNNRRNFSDVGYASTIGLSLRSNPWLVSFIVSMIAAAWLCMASTGIIQSGYPFFPNPAFGPIGNHAVSRLGAIDVMDRSIKAYARSNDDNSEELKAYAPLTVWLKPFLRSGRGRQMITWASAALFASLGGIVYTLFISQNLRAVRLTALSISSLIAVIAALLVLPPNPRFFAWLGALAFFVALNTLRYRPLLGLLAASVISTALVARGQRNLLVSVGAPTYTQQTEARDGLHGWRSSQQGNSVIIHRPETGDQCWAIPSPCSPYRAGLKSSNAKKLLR